MVGGKISGNSNTDTNRLMGGGVYVFNGTFTMLGGEISGNTANANGYGGGGVYVGGDSTFTMQDGKISGNTTTNGGGGVYVDDGNTTVFRIVNGIIYGSGEAEGVRNTATTGAALYKGANGIAEYGTFNGQEWNKTENGDLDTTNNTIKVEGGELIQ
jgi:hypothetical protein